MRATQKKPLNLIGAKWLHSGVVAEEEGMSGEARDGGEGGSDGSKTARIITKITEYSDLSQARNKDKLVIGDSCININENENSKCNRHGRLRGEEIVGESGVVVLYDKEGKVLNGGTLTILDLKIENWEWIVVMGLIVFTSLWSMMLSDSQKT